MQRNIIIIVSILLSIIGLVMIYSASSIWATYKMDFEYYYLLRQTVFFLISIVLMIFIAKIDYHVYQKYAKWFFLLGLAFLILVLIPGVGIVRGGAQSWIGFGVFSFQPSEFMKLALVIFLSNYLAKHHHDLDNLKSFIGIVTVILIPLGLIMLEPDFGSGMVMTITGFLILYVRGIKKQWIVSMLLIGVFLIGLLIMTSPYRLERIVSYLNPWNDPLGSGFQAIQSLYALSPGGIFGLGLFKSRQKFFYLPEPQTDFIFAIITEELGLIGSFLIISLFFILIYCGYVISLQKKDLFGFYLAIGITSLLFVQFIINISVVIGLLPVTGITLPFLSYGGSSLLINFLMIGILFNIGNKDKTSI